MGLPSDFAGQVLVVMRHGRRLDEADMTWEKTADRPWDPPLFPDGISEVNSTGI
jgi:hypothetical protein